MLETDKSGEATPSESLPEGVTSERLLEWLDGMLLIRYFESESVRLSLAGKIPGGIHSSEGQEAVAVGTMAALDGQDVASGTHRSHHHALAKGLGPRPVMAELFGKATGVSGGRGGSMHLVDADRRFLGSNGIVFLLCRVASRAARYRAGRFPARLPYSCRRLSALSVPGQICYNERQSAPAVARTTAGQPNQNGANGA